MDTGNTNQVDQLPTSLVKNLFYLLKEEDVEYVVLRGYETLPEKIINDIDIYLPWIHWNKTLSIVEKICQKYELVLIQNMNRLGFIRIIIFSNILQIQLDFSFYINWKGFEYCQAIQIKSNQKKYNNITVLTEGVEAAIVLMKEILHNGKVKTRRKGRERLLFCVQKEHDIFEAVLTPFLDSSLIKELSEQILNQQWSAIESRTKVIRRALVLSNLKTKPISTFISFLSWFFLAIADRLSTKTGCFAAIIGPDGSGKTTLVNAVNKDLDGILFTKTNHFASNFEILPLLSSILQFLKGKGTDKRPRSIDQFQGIHSAMQQKANSPLRSCIYIIWYSLDLILGRFILLQKKSRGELIFFARYFYDYYYQLANKNAPRWLLNFMLYFIPKPDLVFYIDRDAHNIFELKPELSVEEIERQQRIIVELSDKHERFVRIDGNGGIESSKDQIVDALANFLASRLS